MLCTYVCMHVYTYMCIYIYTHIHILMYMYVYVHIYVYTHTHTHTHTRTPTWGFLRARAASPRRTRSGTSAARSPRGASRRSPFFSFNYFCYFLSFMYFCLIICCCTKPKGCFSKISFGILLIHIVVNSRFIIIYPMYDCYLR